MNCMKCGREIEEGQAFCPYCLVDMESYPVNPGTVILLPSHKKDAPPPKKHILHRQPQPEPEEYVPVLKRKLWATRVLCVLLCLILGVMGYVTSRVITELDIQRLLGQNYSTIEIQEETEAHTQTMTETAADSDA